MNTTQLPSGGDIFVSNSAKKQGTPLPPKKSMHWLKTASIVSVMLFFVVGINIVVAAAEQPVKHVEQTANPPERERPAIYDILPPVTTPAFNQAQVAGPEISNDDDDDDDDNDNRRPTPTPFNIAPIINPISAPDLGGGSNQINQLQNQIVQQMNQCIQITRQAQGQIAQLRARQQQLEIAQQEINRARSNINFNDPNADAMREELRQEYDAISIERNQVISQLNTTRNQFSTARSECQNTVWRIQSAKRNLETQLQTAFQQALNITL